MYSKAWKKRKQSKELFDKLRYLKFYMYMEVWKVLAESNDIYLSLETVK